MVAEGMCVRPLWKDILAAVWLGMVLPGIVLHAFVWKEKQQETQRMPMQPVQQIRKTSKTIRVYDPDGTNFLMNLDDYLVCVLLAEMPATFHEEALKAQAVAARTYAWKAYTQGTKHPNGGVCTDSACCQAFLTETEYISRGGDEHAPESIRKAVQATGDMVLFYAGDLIEATYFSSTGGKTESALAVWGADYPYLQTVNSPEEGKETVATFSAEEFQRRIGRALPGNPMEWFGSARYTEGDGVASIEICGEEYTGTALRTLLGLHSTDFEVRTDEERITFRCHGYGHRVGMSQYGANAMAEAGSTWQMILQHYYPGTILCPLS